MKMNKKNLRLQTILNWKIKISYCRDEFDHQFIADFTTYFSLDFCLFYQKHKKEETFADSTIKAYISLFFI